MANLGLLPSPDSGASTGPLAAIIPADQLAIMEQVAGATPCAIPWSVLVGVAYIESDFGQNLGPIVSRRVRVAARIRVRCLRMLFCSFTNAGLRQRRA
jgi:hypothetical protein